MKLKMKTKNYEEKKKVMLCGTLLFPITVGKPAVFAAEGSVYRTSNVVALHEQTEDNIHFEMKGVLDHGKYIKYKQYRQYISERLRRYGFRH